jgi:hypothetical protein
MINLLERLAQDEAGVTPIKYGPDRRRHRRCHPYGSQQHGVLARVRDYPASPTICRRQQSNGHSVCGKIARLHCISGSIMSPRGLARLLREDGRVCALNGGDWALLAFGALAVVALGAFLV